MATRAVFAKVKQRASKGPRKKRTRPEPRQYTADPVDTPAPAPAAAVLGSEVPRGD